MAENTSKTNNQGLQRVLLIILALIVAVTLGVVFALTYVNQQALASDRSIEVGDEFLAAGEYELAEEIYLGTVGKSSLSTNRLINLYTRWANSLIGADADPDIILPILEKLISYYPENMDVYYAMASLNRAKGNTEEAEAICLRALEINYTSDKIIRYYADLLLARDARQAAAAHYEKYATANDNVEYALLASSLYPSAPTFSVSGGSYGEHFTFDITYKLPSSSLSAASPATEDEVTVYYTVDGTVPFDVTQSTTSPIPAFEYTESIDTSRFYTGKPLVITAVAVDKYGMVSKPATVEYTFDMEYVPVTSVELSKTSVRLEEEEQTALRVTLEPYGATNKNIVWVSSDENFVTVDQNGFITAVKYTANEDLAIRTATETTVTVTAISLGDGLSATCEVTVVPSKTTPSTSYNSSKKYLEVGLKAMQEINPDIVGYIKMDNVTGVPDLPHSPIYVKESDSDFYLSHTSDGTENGYGEVTVAEGVRLSSLGRNTVIVANYVPDGKNEGNSLLGSAADLDQYPAWYLDGSTHYVYVNTMDGAYIFQVFSWYHPDGSFNGYMTTEFATMDEFLDFCKAAEDADQLYNTASPRFYSNDRILTLVIYKDGQVYSVMHGRVAKYKSLTSGVPAFFDDDLDGYVEPDEPDEPDVPDVPVDPVEPDTPEVPVDPEIPEEPTEPDVPEVPEEPEALEGDLDGDGQLSAWERYQLNRKKQQEAEAEAEGSEDSEPDLTDEEEPNE